MERPVRCRWVLARAWLSCRCLARVRWRGRPFRSGNEPSGTVDRRCRPWCCADRFPRPSRTNRPDRDRIVVWWTGRLCLLRFRVEDRYPCLLWFPVERRSCRWCNECFVRPGRRVRSPWLSVDNGLEGAWWGRCRTVRGRMGYPWSGMDLRAHLGECRCPDRAGWDRMRCIRCRTNMLLGGRRVRRVLFPRCGTIDPPNGW